MVYDINQYGVMKMPKSNATLKAMTKAELIEYIRILEHDYNVAVEFNERQARNVEQMMKDGRLIEQKHGHWIKSRKYYDDGYTIIGACSVCGLEFQAKLLRKICYCPHCGAKMELKELEK